MLLLVKTSSIAQVVNTLEERGSMDYTIIVAAAADSPQQYSTVYRCSRLRLYVSSHISCL
jgi:F0F1-type ATP synthase alpha subunit